MAHVPLAYRNGHLFFDLDGHAWLVDTGAPMSFGRDATFLLADQSFPLAESFNGLTAERVAGFVGAPCRGLIGVDILGRFDVRFDVARNCAEVSDEAMELADGPNTVRSEALMGIPIVDVVIGHSGVRMFFDTGAQYSFSQDNTLTGFPFVGRVTDFHPSIGQFEIDTYLVNAQFAGQTFQLRTGCLPDQLSATIVASNTVGVIGNEVFTDHVVTYAPRRSRIEFS